MTIVTTPVAKCEMCGAVGPANLDTDMNDVARHPSWWVSVGTVACVPVVCCSWECASTYAHNQTKEAKDRTLKEQFARLRNWGEASAKPSDPSLSVLHGDLSGPHLRHKQEEPCQVCDGDDYPARYDAANNARARGGAVPIRAYR